MINSSRRRWSATKPKGGNVERLIRRFSLPDDIDTSKVEAKYRDGILQVSIGLLEWAQPQRIQVQ